MYTQCPECSAAFRVTANDLKQAAGKVRCGGCGSAFDALEFLSEEMPQQPPTKESARQLPELKPAHRAGELPEKISPEESIALLKTLDELAGSDIRVEDTGIEWRVLDDQVIAELETADTPVDEAGAENESGDEPASDSREADNDQSAKDVGEGSDDEPASEVEKEVDDEPPSDEPRYDDDTPMPEDSGEDDSAAVNDEDKSGDEAPEAAAPVDQAPAEETPDEESEPQSDELDVAFDDDETGDWEEILDEFDEPDTMAPADDTNDEDVREPVDEDAGDEIDAEDNDEQEDGGVDEDEGRDGETENVDEEEHRDDQVDNADADEGRDDDETADVREDERRDDEIDDVDEDESRDDEIGDLDTDEGRDDDETAELREDERHDDEIDDVGEDQDSGGEDVDDDERLPEVQEEAFEVESIIMEGETVRNALDELADDEPAADANISYWVLPEDDAAPARSAAASSSRTLGVVLLLLLLSLQVVHYYRDTLATMPAIQKIIAPVYRTIGMPLSPDWDVTAWRFEATQGNSDSDNDELVVFSRIGNTGNTSLPYPLIGISLTDRFDETVGSRLLEPQEFLSEGTNPRKRVPAGATFDAVISIKAPDTLATGYKLNVCYRSTGGASAGRLRCAIGDFKE